jgi:hypothetical protein
MLLFTQIGQAGKNFLEIVGVLIDLIQYQGKHCGFSWDFKCGSGTLHCQISVFVVVISAPKPSTQIGPNPVVDVFFVAFEFKIYHSKMWWTVIQFSQSKYCQRVGLAVFKHLFYL